MNASIVMDFITARMIFENSLKIALGKSACGHQARAYRGLCRMKRLGVFLLPPGWDASPSQGYLQHLDLIRRYLFIHLGGERHCES